jgi:hypothetical protein
MKTFEKFIEEHYKGFNFISIPSEALVPGVIINSDDRIVDSVKRIFTEAAPNKWGIKTIKANMHSQVIAGERKLDLGITLLGLFSLKGGASSKYDISFEFNDVTEIVFDTQNGGAYENEIRGFIMDLKQANRSLWKSILHEHVVMEVVIVKTATVQFKRSGNIVGEAQIEDIKNDISINGSYSWNNEGKMVIKNDNNIPFGVLDFQIKRSM